MLFVIFGIDKPGTDMRSRLIDAHRAYMATAPLKILSSGPLMEDGSDTMIGSLLIVEAAGRAEVDAFLAEEPMAQAGIYETLEVRRWYQRVGSFTE